MKESFHASTNSGVLEYRLCVSWRNWTVIWVGHNNQDYARKEERWPLLKSRQDCEPREISYIVGLTADKS